MDATGASDLADFLARHERVAVLTGAGCSTASGIPGYRDERGEWRHAPPVQYADFLGSAATRRRYWARSYSGWQRVAAAAPNAAHHALAALGRAERVEGLITQNVDGLHRRAGSRDVLDLHGVLDRVRCLDCRAVVPRAEYQRRLAAANPDWTAVAGDLRPDGDVDVAVATEDFAVPGCAACGGLLKPDVVFFGEAVPAGRVALARRHVSRASALLVVGSSLMVFSGFRFVREASAAGKPVAIVNRGRTRGDDYATLRIDGDCGALLAAAARTLLDRVPDGAVAGP